MEEGSVSILPRRLILHGESEGDACKVKVGKYVHEGKIVAVGK